MNITVKEEFRNGPDRILGEFSDPHEARRFAAAYLLDHAKDFECPENMKEYDAMQLVPLDVAFREDWADYAMHTISITAADPSRGTVLLAEGNRSALEWINPEDTILNEKEHR